ncbi:MAG: ArgE/DapE family deacylase, partial [Solirubrobacteraceae bacterium]
MGAARPDDGAVRAAVGAGQAEVEDLIEDLVRARTLLGAEAAGQDVMRRAFSGLGLDPVDVPLDPAALRDSPAASP